MATFNLLHFFASQTKFQAAMETAVRNVRSVVDRDADEMDGVVQAVGTVTQGTQGPEVPLKCSQTTISLHGET